MQQGCHFWLADDRASKEHSRDTDVFVVPSSVGYFAGPVLAVVVIVLFDGVKQKQTVMVQIRPAAALAKSN